MSGTSALELQPVASSPARARRFVAGRLDAWGLGAVADEVLLLTSEVVTNALVHAATAVCLEVEPARGGGVRVSVQDGSSVLPVRRRPSGTATTGRGVALLEQLADRWGAERTPDGKRVWFEVSGRRDPWPAA